MIQNGLSDKVKISLWFTFIALTGVAALYFLYQTRFLLLLCLIGVGIGVLVAPLIKFLERKWHVPRGISALLVAFSLLATIAGVFYCLYVIGAGQFSLITERAPEIARRLRLEFDGLVSQHAWLSDSVANVDYEAALKRAAQSIFTGVGTVVGALGALLIVLSIGLFTAINSKSYFKGLLSAFPHYARYQVARVGLKSASVLRQWFSAQLLVVLITGLATTFGLWMIGIDYWLVLGVLTFVLGFIPFAGAYITGTLATLITLGSHPEKVWWVVGLYVIVQQTEGNITVPLMMKGQVKLPEAHLLIFIVIMGGLFGLLGVFMAPGLFTVLRTIYMMTWVPKMNAIKNPRQ